jgi:hypothetical protein
MKSKLFIVPSSLILLTSRELVQYLVTSQTTSQVLKNRLICTLENYLEANECKIEYLLRFWYEVEDISWPDRKK